MIEDTVKRIVEIGGVKVEVDLREAKQVDTYKVGDLVKILVKEYGDTYKTEYGVIVDFLDFKKKPAIEVMSVSPGSYRDEPLKWHTITADDENREIAPLSHGDALFQRDDILKRIDRSISDKESELKTLHLKRQAFLEHFGKFFALEEEPEHA